MFQYYIILVVALIISFVLIYILYSKTTNLSSKIKTLTKTHELASIEPEYVPAPVPIYRAPQFNLGFATSIENVPSRESVFQQMRDWKSAGIVYSTDSADNTILSLQRKLVLPGRYIGHETKDESVYNYRVVDKHGFIIELPKSYSQLLDDAIIDTIPSMESKGSFKVNLFSTSYINVPMMY